MTVLYIYVKAGHLYNFSLNSSHSFLQHGHSVKTPHKIRFCVILLVHNTKGLSPAAVRTEPPVSHYMSSLLPGPGMSSLLSFPRVGPSVLRHHKKCVSQLITAVNT